MSKVLVLGAGVYQVPLIRQALADGHEVCVASWSAADPGMALAHDAWTVDTTDQDTLLRLATEKGVQAVVTTGTDVAVPSIGHLCDHLGLPGISYETAVKCSNKIPMQEAFQSHGVRTAAHWRVDSLEEARQRADEAGYPVIMKAPDSSGSRGVVAANRPEELAAAFEQAMRVSRCGSVLLETLLQGQEFGGQVIVLDGRVLCCLFHNDTVTPPPISVPIGHSCPFRMPEDVVRDAQDVCAAAVAALGIRNAVCNADLILTGQGVHMLEMGARIGATGIPEIIRLHAGIDLYQTALALAFGDMPEVKLNPGPAAAFLVVPSPATGRLVRCEAPPDLLARPGIVSIGFDHRLGAEVRRFRVGPDRIGEILVTAPTALEAERLCQEAAERLQIDVDPSASP